VVSKKTIWFAFGLGIGFGSRSGLYHKLFLCLLEPVSKVLILLFTLLAGSLGPIVR
jgi:uncharacterized integral membrane protein